ncbi:MAG: GNAT family N-acetyltransferase [Bauldia sp.]
MAPRPDVTIAIETPLQDDLRELIADLNAYLIPLSPIEFQFKMTVDQMAKPDTTVFVARDRAGRAVGCGALKVESADLAEVKRMFTRPELRGRRIGAAILDEIEALARRKGVATLMLETGEAPGFEPAYRLYENAGFTRRGAFLDYPDSGWSRFYEKYLR